jgi:glucose-1-phosphate thymidylyltransferase
MEIARALILAGSGIDDRPWPTAPATPKHLFPVANRPILFHNLERLRESGILEAEILADADTIGQIADAVAAGPDFGITIGYEEWRPTVGLGGALAAGRRFMRDEPVLVQRGDALLRESMGGHISLFARERLDAMALRLSAVTRRPIPAPAYLLSTRAVSILLGRPQVATSPIDRVEALGGRVLVHDVHGVLSCDGNQDALLESNRVVLEGLTPSAVQPPLEDCIVQGAVEIHPTATVCRTTLRGPLVVGPGACVTDSYIGPYTSIGENVTLEGVEIEHSIVLEDADLRFVGTRLESSVIGRGARVARSFRPPGAFRLSLGEGAEVVLG